MMCGIAGFVGYGTMGDLGNMVDLLSHRGPDDQGQWCDEAQGVFLGHTRLSIIDIEGGAQPMSTADGSLHIVFNGEIYNHRQLRRELESRGHHFLSDHSDTEVLLMGYREWGTDLPEKLNGMWAFAVYDAEKNRIFLSRDRFGQKPLYYFRQQGTFCFSSELKSLVSHSRVAGNVSVRSLQKYFAYGFIPAPNALFEGVSKLPGGHNLVLNTLNLSCRVQQYWDFIIEPFEEIPKDPVEEWGLQFRELLSNSVRRRLMSDVPLGVFLSGGIDSSGITAFACRLGEKERIKTFNVGFAEASFDESSYARYAASVYRTRHHDTILSLEDLEQIHHEIIEKIDEPFGDSSIIPTYLLSRETKKHVTVALSGDGADELFSGYDPFHALRRAELYQKIVPRPMHKAVRLIAARMPVSHRHMSFGFKVNRFLRGLSYAPNKWNPIWLGPLEPSELFELLDEPVDPEDLYAEAIEYWDRNSQQHIVDKTLQFYTKLYLQDDILTKSDRAGMMHGLEIRAPYLDPELADFVRRIPWHFKYRKGRTKYIMRKAFGGIVPQDILTRPKHGFGAPVGGWFKSGKLDISDSSNCLPLNGSFVRKLHQEHRHGKKDHRLFLWNYFLLDKYMLNLAAPRQGSC
jgi:asparagine synthase (glutamine-hydrolysing)